MLDTDERMPAVLGVDEFSAVSAVVENSHGIVQNRGATGWRWFQTQAEQDVDIPLGAGPSVADPDFIMAMVRIKLNTASPIIWNNVGWGYMFQDGVWQPMLGSVWIGSWGSFSSLLHGSRIMTIVISGGQWALRFRDGHPAAVSSDQLANIGNKNLTLDFTIDLKIAYGIVDQ